MGFDVVVVGAGSAGCVIAAALSEDPRRSVLLVEAGPDYPTEESLPSEIRRGFNPTLTHDWGFASEPGALGRAIPLPRGKLVGGCSATNASMALRGDPADYDEWASLGNSGWSFDELLPFFKRIETDSDFDNEWHGRTGPLPVRRYSDSELLPENRAFLEACRARGHAAVADLNSPSALGAGRVPVNTAAGVRRSAALAWLAPARSRRNLAIRAGALVDRIVFEGRRATGVRCVPGGETIEAGTIIIAAGAYASPAILLRSGLGPASELRQLGIDVVQDLPAVGRNLVDHPMVMIRFAAPPPAPPRASEAPGCQVMLRLRSSSAPASHDLQIFQWALAQVEPAASPTGEQLRLYAALVKPRSSGAVRLRSSDPLALPRIDQGYLTHPSDLPRLRECLREALRLAATPPLSALALEPLDPVVRPESSDDELDSVIRSAVRTYYHPVGTCRMGPPGDPRTVVDQRGRVAGVEELLVVDASIMPTIPAANTNLPTLMLAERCARWFAEAS